ncbi:hypothetical protein D3C78_1744460 [compost metagenome]
MSTSTAAMNRITAQVSHGNSHILKAGVSPRAIMRWRMRSWEMAIAMYTSSAIAPEVASSTLNTASGTR